METKCECGADRIFSDSQKTVICPNCDLPKQRPAGHEERDRALTQLIWDILTLPYKQYGIKVPETPFGREQEMAIERPCQLGCGRMVPAPAVRCDVCAEITYGDIL